MIRNVEMPEPSLRDHAPKVGIRIVEALYDFHYLAVIEAEPGIVLVGLHSGKPVHQPVVPLPDPEHQPAFSARRLDADHNRITFLPFMDHFNDQLRRVLQVGDNTNDGVPNSLIKRVYGRPQVPKVAGISYDLNAVSYTHLRAH